MPRKLLVVYDDARGMCARVVPRMVQMLKDRAFEVEVRPMGDEPEDVSTFDGVVIGSPVSLRSGAASARALAWVASAQGLDEKRVAVFTAYWLRPGAAGEQLQAKVAELGAEVVVNYAYWLVQPKDGEHFLPAECMVRIR